MVRKGSNRNLNPSDVLRKQQRKRELKKNKEKRKVQREGGLLKKDINQIKSQISKLEELETKDGKLDKRMKARKKQLLGQHELILQKKTEMDHVPTRSEYEDAMTVTVPKTAAELEQENAFKYQNPELSIYYHPTLNPFGAPPPGAAPMFRSPTVAQLGGPSAAPLALPSTAPPPVPVSSPSSPPTAPSESTESEMSSTGVNEPKQQQQETQQQEEEDDDDEIDLESIPLPKEPPPPLPPTATPMMRYAPPTMGHMAPPLAPFAPPGIVPPPPPSLRPMTMPNVYNNSPAAYIQPSPYLYVPPPQPVYHPPSQFAPPRYQPPTPQLAPQLQHQQQMVHNVNIPHSEMEQEETEESTESSAVELTTRFVPTALRVKRDTTAASKVKSKTTPQSNSTQQHKAKDDAYDLFMKDMKELGAV